MPTPKNKGRAKKSAESEESENKIPPEPTKVRKKCELIITGVSYADVLQEHMGIPNPSPKNNIEYIENQKPDTHKSEEKIRAEYFLDSKKNRIKLWPTMIDHANNDLLPLYTNKPCRNCHHSYETHPIGCPIKYVPHISDPNDPKRKKIEKFLKDSNFLCDSTDYFETECMFCSFPCVKSYIMYKLSMQPSSYKYNNALTYLSLLYKKLFSLKTTPVIPSAHDIDALISYNGHLSISEYRNTIGVLQFDKSVNIRRPIMFTSFTYIEETAAHTEKDYL